MIILRPLQVFRQPQYDPVRGQSELVEDFAFVK